MVPSGRAIGLYPVYRFYDLFGAVNRLSVRRFGTRLFFTLAAFCVGVGWAALGSVKSLPALYCFYGLAGVGASFVYTGGIAAALKWYPQKRGLASGVMAAGFGSGAALFIPLFGYLLASYGSAGP